MEAVEIARQALRARLDDRWDSNRIFLRLVRDDALRTGAFEDALAWYRETQIPGVHGERIFIVDVELLALNGETNAALDSLREAVNGGWKTDWKWHLGNENLASLRGEPRFRAIIEQLESDMAVQLEAVRALPYMGEFDLRSAQNN
jgi:hypothetical protein